MVMAEENIPLDNEEALRHALTSITEGQSQQAIIDVVVALLMRLSSDNKRLQLRLQKTLRSLHGRKSEKLNEEQLSLFRDLLTAIDDDAFAKPERKKKHKSKARAHGRNRFPESLRREKNVIAVEDADRTCPKCGTTKTCIGHVVSERLEYNPASLHVIQDMREKVACDNCEAEVSVAPTAPKLVDGGMAAEGLLAHTVVSKYVDGLTLTRLSNIYSRSGVTLAESTLGDFVRAVAHSLGFLATHIEQRILRHHAINVDDTGLRVLDRDHPKGVKRGHIWAYVADHAVAYKYTPDWRGEHPREFLKNYVGIIQADGYAGIKPLFEGDQATATLAGCWMHCRRYFLEAYEGGDARGGIALAIIHDIYALERTAKDANAAPDERLLMRQTKSLPLVARLKKWMGDIEHQAPPKTPLGKAFTYANNQWDALLVPFYDGRLELDNGEAERRLKVLATGRKAWLFAGSDAGGERAATILTVLGTAVINGVDPLAYLTDVLKQIANGISAADVGQLLPDVWAKQRGQQPHAHQIPVPRLVG